MKRLAVIILLVVFLPCLEVYNGYGEILAIDTVTAVGNQAGDISYRSIHDDGESGASFENPDLRRASLASTKTVMLYINEFMADNKATIENPAKPGSFEDWIELYNAGASAINLGGMYLSDKLSDPTQWQIPAGVTIPSGGYLLFWADGDETLGNTHTNFKLSKSGEEIGIFGTDGVTVIDSIKFDAQITDVSYGRYPNGMADWGFMRATPGAANNPHNAPPKINGTMHTPESPTKSDQVWVTSTVTDDGALADVTLTYRAAGSNPVNIKMYDDGAHHDTGVSDGIFGTLIPAQNTVVTYYITATDNVGSKSTAPATAPAVTFLYVVGYLPPQVYINEFMADSNAAINTINTANTANAANIVNTANGADGAGGHEDWIELYNAGASPVNLGGMYLTDNLSDPTQWQIPAGVIIPSDGYLLFWADGNNEQGTMHTNFKLSKSGEEIGLFNTDAKGNLPIDTVTFGEQATDISSGRIYDSGAPWVFFENATPGSQNFFPAGTHNFIWKFSYTIDSYTVIRKFRNSVSDAIRDPTSNTTGDTTSVSDPTSDPTSDTIIDTMSNRISVIKGINATTGRLEAAYPFWANPAGVNFPIMPGCDYIISIITLSQ